MAAQVQFVDEFVLAIQYQHQRFLLLLELANRTQWILFQPHYSQLLKVCNNLWSDDIRC